MSYKWSKFNLITDFGDNVVITNTLYFSCTRIKKNSHIFESYKHNDIEKLTDRDIQFLLANNMIVDTDKNETEFCDFVRNRSVFADSILDITILPTDACNFRCIYCYESVTNQSLSDECEQSILKFIKKNIHKYKQVRLAWFGGEPLVRKEQVLRITIAINNICKQNGVLFSGRMTTNGYELDLNTFNTLTRNRIFSYQICIDGNRISHNQQRPHAIYNDSYERIIYNISQIKQHANTNTFLISLRTNVTNDTEPYIESYLRDVYDIIGCDKRFEIVFQGVRDWGGDRLAKNNVSLIENESSIYEKWYLTASNIGLNSAETMDLSVTTSMCAGNYINGFVIYPDCSVHKCTLAYFGSDQSRSQGCIGYIDRNGNLTLDYSRIMQWMYHDTHNTECLECPLYPICKGGACPYSSNIIGHKINKSKNCRCIMAMVKSKILCLENKNLINYYPEDK